VTTPVGREEWNRRYAATELLWTARPNRFLVAEAGDLRPCRALDLACGEGRNAVWLAEQSWRVTGVDFSDVALAKARNLAAARGVEVDWVQADLLAYRPGQRAYDLVLLFYLQLPAAQRREVVRAAAEAVAPGGTLLLVAHDSRNLEHGHGGPKEASVLYTAADGAVTALDALVRARRP
jgi:2-polyprenyl-3-methyl-5-hydroxy-6-metoxy-1,4-benzoquinol methylase